MWRVAAILFCFAYSGAWATSQRPDQVAAAVRLHHPLHGARVCSEHVEHNQIIIGVRSMPQSATVSVSINDVDVSTFPLEAGTESQFLEVPLSGYDDSSSMASPGAHRISIAVFDELGDDLQPEIHSEFFIFTCEEPQDVARARQSLVASHVGGDDVHSAGRASIAVISVQYAVGQLLHAYVAALTFLVVSCQPCGEGSASKIEIMIANSGYLVVVFQPTYAGNFSIFLHANGAVIQSFVFDVGQHYRLHVRGSFLPTHLSTADAAATGPHRPAASSLSFDASTSRHRAIATMISSDSYVTGAVLLLWGISNHGQVGDARCVCLVTQSVSASARRNLQAAGWELISVDVIESSSRDVVEEKWRQQFTKLHLFSLTEFSQVLYLDSDTVVKGSLQAAWLCSAPICGAPDVFHPIFFNCGVLVLTPNSTELQLIHHALPSLPAHESEQSALNEYFLKRFHPLHISLNFQKHR
jgi:hypothetical protein